MTPERTAANREVELPLVEKPVAVRYGWATSPMGNLKVNGHPMVPIPSFRTDDWDWPESEDPDVYEFTGTMGNEVKEHAIERCEYRRTEEARRAVEILERIKTLGRWQESEPVTLTLEEGENTLRFSRSNPPQYGMAIKDFTLAPVK
ncbi:MAG TPA: hypothetical protein VMY42_17300 [Thermoguttaceae bacterium]|nr:hypothetical protein [Thermoguttaceae bacterium]